MIRVYFTGRGNGGWLAQPLLRRGGVSGPPQRAAGIGLDEAPVPAPPLTRDPGYDAFKSERLQRIMEAR